MTDRTRRPLRSGRLDLARRHQPRAAGERQPAGARRQQARRRRHQQPDDLPEGAREGHAYDDQLRDLAGPRGRASTEPSGYLTGYDIRWACDVLRPVYDRTERHGRPGVDRGRPAHSPTRPTRPPPRRRGCGGWSTGPTSLIKIPATAAGLPSITAATAAGISVNVTLIFGLDRYDEVMDAYLTGLEQAKAAGIDLSTIRSVASFFVSRVDTEIDKRLDKIGTDEAQALRGKAGIANARLAYERYEKVFASDRWKALDGRGRQRAASAVGLDRRQGPGLRRHDVRRRTRRAEHGQHHARGHARTPSPTTA